MGKRYSVVSRSTGEFCYYCGRELEDVEEPSAVYDQTTGERPMVVWRQCPKYAKNALQAMIRGSHISRQRDGLGERQWT